MGWTCRVSRACASPDQIPAISQVRGFPFVSLDDREIARGVAMAVEPFQVAKHLHFDAMRAVVEQLAIVLARGAPDGPEVFRRSRRARGGWVCRTRRRSCRRRDRPPRQTVSQETTRSITAGTEKTVQRKR